MFNWLKRRSERDLEAEFASHLAIEIRARVAAGEDPDEAARNARRVFGNAMRLREETRETWGWAPIEQFLDDVRFGARNLRKSPVWTSVVLLMLAAGIAIATAIFSLVYAILLRPLPYPDPGRLMALWITGSGQDRDQRFNVNPANWRDWVLRNRTFQSIALTRPIANFNLTGNGAPERLEGARVSANLISILGIPPLLGRNFQPSEADTDARVAILSYGLWRRRFAADPAIVGRKIDLNGTPFEVIGVMPATFQYPAAGFELWTPLYIPPQLYITRFEYGFLAVGRLRDGVTRPQAQGDLSNIMSQLAEEYPVANRDRGVLVEPLLESTGRSVRKILYVLLGASLCLLLIGCMNLSVLLIGRANARAREMALRAALGAASGRLGRQVLAETLPLAVAGACGGILLAWLLLGALRPWLPPDLPRSESIGLYWPVVGFSALVSLAVVCAATLLPARFARRRDPRSVLAAESGSVSARTGVRDLLVIGQIAIALVLAFGASLLARSLAEAMRVPLGFSTSGVLTMHLAVTRARYPSDRDVADYYRRLEEQIASIPGVIAAGFVNRLPLTGLPQVNPVVSEQNADAPSLSVDTRSITSGYFNAMGIPVLRGRPFSNLDTAASPPVVIIDDALSRSLFGTADPLGRRIRQQFGDLHDDWAEIVGVVGHIRNDTPESSGRSQLYYPDSQRAQDRAALVIRTAGDPSSFAAAVIRRIRSVNPEQPVYDVRTMHEWFDRSLEARDLLTGLVALFSGASLALCCLGLYGVLSYNAGLRKREFGIRVAVGAQARQIHGLVLRHAARLSLLGCAAGLFCLWPALHVVRALLFGVEPGDPLTFAFVPALLVAIGLLAAFIPALKAGRIDPAEMLRVE